MRVDIEELIRVKEYLRNINKRELTDIVFYENNKEVIINKKAIEDFTFIGLNNADFILGGYYENK